MKRAASIVIALTLALALAACGAPAPASTVPPASSTPAPPASSAASAATAVDESSSAAQPPAMPERDAFIAQLNAVMVPVFISAPVAGREDLENDDAVWGAQGLATWVLHAYNAANGIADPAPVDGVVRYPVDGPLREVTEELFGFAYDFEKGYEHFGAKGDPPGVTYIDAFSPGIYATPILDSYATGEDGLITLNYDVKMVPGEGDAWVMRYTFRYLPENTYFPYQLVSVESPDGSYQAHLTAMAVARAS